MSSTVEFASHFIVADGIRTHYLEAGSGPVVVLMHGGGAGADSYGNWRECISVFAKRFRVIAPDMVGFGRSDKPSPESYTYDQAGRNRQLVALLDSMKLEEGISDRQFHGRRDDLHRLGIHPNRVIKWLIWSGRPDHALLPHRLLFREARYRRVFVLRSHSCLG